MKKYKINYEYIRFILKLNRISAKDLAEQIGIKRQTLYYWKAHGTTLDNIQVITYYLNKNFGLNLDYTELIECEINDN